MGRCGLVVDGLRMIGSQGFSDWGAYKLVGSRVDSHELLGLCFLYLIPKIRLLHYLATIPDNQRLQSSRGRYAGLAPDPRAD